jgi:hypothetical protein
MAQPWAMELRPELDATYTLCSDCQWRWPAGVMRQPPLPCGVISPAPNSSVAAVYARSPGWRSRRTGPRATCYNAAMAMSESMGRAGRSSTNGLMTESFLD